MYIDCRQTCFLTFIKFRKVSLFGQNWLLIFLKIQKQVYFKRLGRWSLWRFKILFLVWMLTFIKINKYFFSKDFETWLLACTKMRYMIFHTNLEADFYVDSKNCFYLDRIFCWFFLLLKYIFILINLAAAIYQDSKIFFILRGLLICILLKRFENYIPFDRLGCWFFSKSQKYIYFDRHGC